MTSIRMKQVSLPVPAMTQNEPPAWTSGGTCTVAVPLTTGYVLDLPPPVTSTDE